MRRWEWLGKMDSGSVAEMTKEKVRGEIYDLSHPLFISPYFGCCRNKGRKKGRMAYWIYVIHLLLTYTGRLVYT